MTPTPKPDMPDTRERARLNATLQAATGFWDDHGIPAPWPDDIEDWTPCQGDPHGPRDF